MARRQVIISAAAALVSLSNFATIAGHAAAAGSTASQALAVHIHKAFPWAQVAFTPATLDGKQFNMVIYELVKGRDLGESIGAQLMNMYVSSLAGQHSYTLTTYVLSTAGSYSDWQYKYSSVTHQLLRLQFATTKRGMVTSWYLTVGQIAQAARLGHWPKNGVIVDK